MLSMKQFFELLTTEMRHRKMALQLAQDCMPDLELNQ